MRKRLTELTSMIATGQIMTRVSCKDDEEIESYYENARVLLPGAISGGTLHEANFGKAVLKKEVSNKRITQKNDIVIKLSSPYDCALVTEDEEGLIVPSFCAIIRGTDETQVDIHYLVGFLNSPYAMSKLMAGINSSAMAMIRGKTLADLQIELPDMQVQKIVGDAYWASCIRKRTLEAMVEQQQRVSDAIIMKAIRK